MSTETSPVDKMIDALGGPTKAARALGMRNPSIVMNWRSRGQVPAERVLDVERVSGISRHELRPDVFGPAPQPERATS